ncbi:MAG: rRNA maturation RNase YbeY [Gammaproteobacteria bacterium]|nr:rRNA maturation RNase YbeY [Gammaproteobacteria bacterium]
MPLKIDLQNDDGIAELPAEERFRHWTEAALQQEFRQLEQTIRIVGEAESRDLNLRFRDKDASTNVLAFPADAERLDYDCLGDLVICAPVVSAEAAAQGKTDEAHWAHLVVHGMLHLQGYDHQQAADTREMESLEIKILDTIGFANPYNV